VPTLNINGRDLSVDAAEDTPLLWVLRDHLGLTGTKFGCGIAFCGACTVHVDGKAVRSCSFPLSAAVRHAITTIEGIGATPIGANLQAAWVSAQVPQCGYCQSGMIMAAAGLLNASPSPSDADISQGITNICRCGTYTRVRAAIHQAAKA
jgi:isoquinoline 1-oxidoreductase alpha subunit